MTVLLAFAGSKGSGKDTCADYLVHKHAFTKYAFANPIKDICRTLFDFSQEQLYGAQRDIVDARYNHTPRQVLQKLGTDFCRDQIDENFWLKYFQRWINDTRNHTGAIVISDIRFQNELDTIRQLGGRVFHVQRKNNTRLISSGVISVDDHASEHQPLVGFQGVIENDSTIPALHEKVASILHK